MITLDTAIGTEVWSTSWGNAFRFKIALISETHVAYLNDKAISTVERERCFLNQKEACVEASRRTFKEAQASMKLSQDWMVKAEEEAK
jgi:hypothetical protein